MSAPENGNGKEEGLELELESVLESSLRLHAQRIELGQAEMLTDVLLRNFDDLDHRLNTYISGSAECEKLRKGMQAYLSRLNSNTLIPLHFRLQVLKRFEQQLDLFDAEMTAAILNAHKIGIDMVQKEALKEPQYYRILVDMVSHAIELAGRLALSILKDYNAPAVITIRQVFDLMRLGMVVIAELGDEAEKEKKRLFLAIARYEMMRNLDFFSKMKSEQEMLMDELEHHIGILKPYYLPRGAVKAVGLKGYSLLVSNLSRPNDTAQVMPFPPQTAITDYIIIPLDDFIDKLVLSVDRAERVLKNPLLQSKDMQIEKALHTTVVGGNAILDALRTKSRDTERQEYGNAKLSLGKSLSESILEVQEEMREAQEDKFEANQVLQLHHLQTKANASSAWTVMNVSKGGIAIERMGGEELNCGVGSMVGLHWNPHRGEPQFGFIRWIRNPKPGEKQMGIKLHLQHYLPVRAVMMAMGDTQKTRSWPVLATFEDDGEHIMVFPDTNVFKGMVFTIGDEGYGGYFKVRSIQSSGPNYVECLVGIADEL